MKIGMKLTTCLWLVVACTAVWMLAGNVAWAAHNTITISVTKASDINIMGNVEVKNNIAPAQTGALKLIVFSPTSSGRLIQRAEFDLGQVNLPAGAGSIVNVPFSFETRNLGLKKGDVNLLADFSSSVDGNAVSHSHCSAMVVIRD